MLLSAWGIESLEERIVLSAALAIPEGIDFSHLWYEETTGSELSEPANPAPFDLADTFFLHSNPDALYTIYLDFDGHVTSGTGWNTAYNNGQDIVSPAYDPDGDGAAFSDNELEQIQRIWQSVAEDFIPFNVNVTTEEPPEDWLIKSGDGDTRWGMRVVVTPDQSVWTDDIGGLIGGIAYLGSFAWDSDTPTFVFNVGTVGAREAASHEVGHTLGLQHDGLASQDYYGGHGTGPTSWGPIMGAAYSVNVSQWSKGEYAGANNQQDDLEIITNPALNGGGYGHSGLSYRADDHGDVFGTASELTIDGGSVVNDAGIIERNTDVDVFAFYTTGGLVSLNIDPYEYAPNLDIKAELVDVFGDVILTSEPSGDLSASFSASLSAGVYYLRIEGSGDDSPGGGYSDYGSIGRYTITGTVPSTDQNQPPSVLLVNQVTGLPDDTSTGSRIKVADIVIVDDLQGVNVLSLSGPDADKFEIIGMELYLRAGVSLNYFVQSSMTVVVNVDDAAIPGSPDGSAVFVLNIERTLRLPEIAGFPATVQYPAGGAQVLLGPSAVLSAPDFDHLGGATIWVTLPEGSQPGDRLEILNQGSWPGQIGVVGQNITYGGEVIGTRTSSALVIQLNSNATVPAVQALLRSIAFYNTNQLPDASVKTVRVQLHDGFHDQRVTVLQTLEVFVQNVPPTLSNFGDTVEYAVGSGPVLLGPQLIVSDVDSPNFAGGQMWVTLLEGSLAGDRLGIRHQGDGAGQIGVNGLNISYEGTVIGTRTGAGLVVTFNGNATLAAVQALLRNLTFSNTTETPPLGSRSVRVQLTDGISPIRATVTKSIETIIPNSPPVISNFFSTVVYNKGAAPVLLDSGVTVTDADSANFDGGKLWVTLPNGAQAGDRLGIRHEGVAAGQIGVSGMFITYGGVVIGTRSSSALVITFNENATVQAVQALLRNLTYHNTLANPVTSHFPVRIQLTDGDSLVRATAEKTLRII